MPKEYYEGPEDGHGIKKKYYRIDEYDGSETLILYHARYQRDLKIKKQNKILSDIENALYSDYSENCIIVNLKSIISSRDENEDEDDYSEEERV